MFVVVAIVTAIGFNIPALVQTASAGNEKVDICHIPPGNPENVNTITVSENAVQSHLDHGDSLGCCTGVGDCPTDPGPACTLEDVFSPALCTPADTACLARQMNRICAVYDTYRFAAGEDPTLAPSGTGLPCVPASPTDLAPIYDPILCNLINEFGGLDFFCDGARFGPATYPFPCPPFDQSLCL